MIVPYECEEEYTLKNLLRNREKLPERVLYIIGSEGGFAPEEIEFLKSKKGRYSYFRKKDTKSRNSLYCSRRNINK